MEFADRGANVWHPLLNFELVLKTLPEELCDATAKRQRDAQRMDGLPM